MVELQSKELRDWLANKFQLPSFYSHRVKLVVNGNVITGVTCLSYSCTKTEQEIVTYGNSKVSSIQSKVQNKWNDVLSVQNQIQILEDRLRYGKVGIFKQVGITKQINALKLNEDKLSQIAREYSERKHEESVTRTFRRECFVALYYWNVDYSELPDVPILGPGINLNQTNLTEKDISKMRIVSKGDLPLATTCNDNALLALIRLDEKLFNQVLEQAEKNRKDAKVKAFLASDKKLKIKFVSGDLENLIA